MPIKIKSTGGGSVSLDVSSTGTDYTLNLPANTGSLLTNASASIDTNLTLTSVPFIRMLPNVNASYNVTATYNELSIGPITVANGVTITVSNGATWVVV